jgi:putative oxidoreductase
MSDAEDSMKRNKIVYWSTTGLIAALMLGSALNFAFNPSQKEAFLHFGLPSWFRVELTIAKIVGSLALIIPWTPAKLREFTYFGFALTIVSADIAHLASGDGPWFIPAHVFFLALLFVSHRHRDDPAPVAVIGSSP